MMKRLKEFVCLLLSDKVAPCVEKIVPLPFVFPIEVQSSRKNSLYAFLYSHRCDAVLESFCKCYGYPVPPDGRYRVPICVELMSKTGTPNVSKFVF